MKYFLLVTALIMFMCSCAPATRDDAIPDTIFTCSEFDVTNITTWVPFELGKTTQYVSADGEIYTLMIDSVYFSDVYNKRVGTGPCSTFGNIYAFSNDSLNLDIDMSVSYSSYYQRDVSPWLSITWMGDTYSFKKYFNYNDTLFGVEEYHDPESVLDIVSFGGKKYNTVHVFRSQSNAAQSLYLAKGHGVVAFTTADSTLYWKQ